MDEKLIKQILDRLSRLESVVLGENKDTAKKKGSATKYKGATGGVRLLVDQGFFSKKRQFGEICEAASSRDYHYSRQAFQEALSRLSKGRELVALTEKGKKVYAIRK